MITAEHNKIVTTFRKTALRSTPFLDFQLNQIFSLFQRNRTGFKTIDQGKCSQVPQHFDHPSRIRFFIHPRTSKKQLLPEKLKSRLTQHYEG
ncbi:hypothetical protein CDZ98_00025 [Mameliella alba]|nr:hypothetical protein CDZ98_00025 [Mameliella alba]